VETAKAVKNCGSTEKEESSVDKTREGWSLQRGGSWARGKAFQRAAEGPDTLNSWAAMLVIGCRAADFEACSDLRSESESLVSKAWSHKCLVPRV
jgi:hypothetical protein